MYILVIIPHGAHIMVFVYSHVNSFFLPSNIGYLSATRTCGKKSVPFGTRKLKF